MTLLDGKGKRELIASYAQKFVRRYFVETGSAQGRLTYEMTFLFPHVITIEKDPENYEAATLFCLEDPEVRVIYGDSGYWLGEVLTRLDGPAFLWLDAHADTVAPGPSALRAELDGIARTGRDDHVILVDDVRLMRDGDGWVSVETLQRWASDHGYSMTVGDDVARLVPAWVAAS